MSPINWLDVISGLTGFLTTASGVIAPVMESGSETFTVGAGTYYAHWFAQTGGAGDIGVLGVKIYFTPTAVALPASWLLLLSGLGVVFGWQRRDRMVAGDLVAA
jgi:hypothetical protein